MKGGPNVDSLAVSPDGRLVAAAGIAERTADERRGATLKVVVWERKSGKIVAAAAGARVFTDNRSPLSMPVGFAQNGRTLIYRQDQSQFVAWDWNGELPPKIQTINVLLPSRCASLSPDGRLLATFSDSETEDSPAIHTWDTHTGTLCWNLSGIAPHAQVDCVTFSPDGKTLAANSNKIAVLWAVPATRGPATLKQ